MYKQTIKKSEIAHKLNLVKHVPNESHLDVRPKKYKCC